MKRLLAMLCALLVLSAPALAHSGKTDGKGGHYNRSTGEYHYHHGYSAHQHPDGVCPYDFDDQTDHSSGGGSVSKPTSTPSVYKPGGNTWYTSYKERNKALATPVPTARPSVPKPSKLKDVLLKAGVFLGYIFIMVVLPNIIDSNSKKRR